MKEPLEIRCMGCGEVINPGQKVAQTKELLPSLNGLIKHIFCEKCGKEKEKKIALNWATLDEEKKALNLDSYWINVAISG